MSPLQNAYFQLRNLILQYQVSGSLTKLILVCKSKGKSHNSKGYDEEWMCVEWKSQKGWDIEWDKVEWCSLKGMPSILQIWLKKDKRALWSELILHLKSFPWINSFRISHTTRSPFQNSFLPKGQQISEELFLVYNFLISTLEPPYCGRI